MAQLLSEASIGLHTEQEVIVMLHLHQHAFADVNDIMSLRVHSHDLVAAAGKWADQASLQQMSPSIGLQCPFEALEARL